MEQETWGRDWRIRHQSHLWETQVCKKVVPATLVNDCSFCLSRLLAGRTGYATAGDAYWVCPDCYRDLGYMFGMTEVGDLSA